MNFILNLFNILCFFIVLFIIEVILFLILIDNILVKRGNMFEKLYFVRKKVFNFLKYYKIVSILVKINWLLLV